MSVSSCFLLLLGQYLRGIRCEDVIRACLWQKRVCQQQKDTPRALCCSLESNTSVFVCAATRLCKPSNTKESLHLTADKHVKCFSSSSCQLMTVPVSLPACLRPGLTFPVQKLLDVEAADVLPPHRLRTKRCACSSLMDSECHYFCHLDIIWVNTPR